MILSGWNWKILVSTISFLFSEFFRREPDCFPYHQLLLDYLGLLHIGQSIGDCLPSESQNADRHKFLQKNPMHPARKYRSAAQKGSRRANRRIPLVRVEIRYHLKAERLFPGNLIWIAFPQTMIISTKRQIIYYYLSYINISLIY